MSDKKLNPAFIIAEYNPFHNGHKYHIEKTKERGATHIVAVMSGNFVQRGDIAICDKHTRAKAALMNGVDLVLELPIKYATSNASYFAKGALEVIKKTGINGFLSFGAKNNIGELLKAAEILSDKKAIQKITDISNSTGLNFPSAQSLYVKENYGEAVSEIFNDANNTLGIEYIKAANELNTNIAFEVIRREGVSHDSLEKNENFASAMSLRKEIYKMYISNSEQYNLYNISKFLPETAVDIYSEAIKDKAMPSVPNKFELLALSRLYSMNAEDFAKINNVNHGLENRIISALKESCSLTQLYDNIKTKRYTHARVRQIITNSVLNISKDFLNQPISYVRILGHNEKGRELLKLMKDSAEIQLISNLSEIDTSDILSAQALSVDEDAGKLFELCKPEPKKANSEFCIKPIIL